MSRRWSLPTSPVLCPPQPLRFGEHLDAYPSQCIPLSSVLCEEIGKLHVRHQRTRIVCNFLSNGHCSLGIWPWLLAVLGKFLALFKSSLYFSEIPALNRKNSIMTCPALYVLLHCFVRTKAIQFIQQPGKGLIHSRVVL